MLKKLLIIISVFVLVGCSGSKKEDFYTLSFDGASFTVGYDSINNDVCLLDSYTTIVDKKNNEILSSITVYLSDVGDVYLDGVLLDRGIKETCDSLDGEYGEKNGHVCLLSKRVNRHDNYVYLYSDILSDDLDRIDHIVVGYK